MTKVSIITPSFNQGRFIEKTIQSVLSQKGDFQLEYIVVDGGSSDNTIDILKAYEGKLQWTSEKDNGQSDAINKGFRRATGDIIAWLNSDDTYYPRAIQKAVEYLNMNPDALMVYGKGMYIDENDKELETYQTGEFDRDRFSQECIICQPTVFMRRRVLDEIGFVDESLKCAMDYDYWWRVSKAGAIGFLPDNLATYRLHNDSKTISQKLQSYTEAIKIVKKYYGYVHPNWLYGYTDIYLQKVFGSRPRGIFPLACALGFRIKAFRVNREIRLR